MLVNVKVKWDQWIKKVEKIELRVHVQCLQLEEKAVDDQDLQKAVDVKYDKNYIIYKNNNIIDYNYYLSKVANNVGIIFEGNLFI